MGLLLNVTSEEKPAKPKPSSSSQHQPHIQRKRPLKTPTYREQAPGRPARHNETSKPGDLTSSLFTSNPAIPAVKCSGEKAKSEELFEKVSFDTLDISSNIKGNLKTEFKCEAMTKVQKDAIPVILTKRDVQIKSPTGSGKTLAYAIPILHFLQSLQPAITRTDGLFAVVIVPTRELVLQTFNVISKLCRAHVRIVPGMLMGGEKKKSEKARLRKGVNILIATPGRLADHLHSTSCLTFERTQMLVLDEADTLVEMGFMKDIKHMVQAIRRDNTVGHQTVLLSATITKGVEDLTELSLKNQAHIELGGDDDDVMYNIPDQLQQNFMILPTKLRLVTLLAFLADKVSKKVIVFLSCKDSVEFHYQVASEVLSKHTEEEKEGEEKKEGKLTLLKLHGSMEQSERVPVYHKFNSCTEGVLFTTDVAARGLDVPMVHWIVQYDSAATVKDYIHRVGRTARAGTPGKSLLFLGPHETNYVDMLQEHRISLKQVKYEKCLERIRHLVKVKKIEDCASAVQKTVEDYCKSKESKGMAIRAFQSYVRAYRSSYFKDKFSELHLGHVAKTFALAEAPSTFLHKDLSRKKQVEARKEHQFERKVKVHTKGEKKRPKKRKLNLVSDSDMAALAHITGPRTKKSKT